MGDKSKSQNDKYESCHGNNTAHKVLRYTSQSSEKARKMINACPEPEQAFSDLPLGQSSGDTLGTDSIIHGVRAGLKGTTLSRSHN